MAALIKDRLSAGRDLGRALGHYRKQPDVLVLALAGGGVPVGAEIARALHAPLDILVVPAAQAVHQRHDLEQCLAVYRGSKPWPQVRGKRVILVDDGSATDAVLFTAIEAMRAHAPASVIVALPVTPYRTVIELHRKADHVVSLATPERFGAIGSWYHSLPRLDDDEIGRILAQRWAEEAASRAPL